MKITTLTFLVFMGNSVLCQVPYSKKESTLLQTLQYPSIDSLVQASTTAQMPFLKLENTSKMPLIDLKSSDKMEILFYKKKEEKLN